MSLVRRGRPSYLTSNRQKKKKNIIKKRPVWDDSLTDLSAYRANAEDLEYRKAVHQSKHLPNIKFQREKAAAQKGEILSTLGKLNPKQLAIMKEILYNQDELQTVLDYSDKLMDNVKDVCGDNPKRYQAFPSVTSAPGSDAEAVFKCLPTELPEYQSRLDLLSNQVMSSVALNDEQQSQDEGSPATATYTSQIDMERFRRLLAAEEENLKNACATPKQDDIFARIHVDSDSDLTDQNTTPDISLFGAPTSAANDTKKVNRVRKIVAENPIPSATQVVLDGTIPAGLNLSDLKKVLEELQSEMALYEHNTGKMAAEKEHRETFSGYTMALLSSVIKLSRYLRETEEKLQTEKKTRELLTMEVSDLKIIVDALTSDLIQTQEMYKNLECQLQSYQQKMDQEICLLKRPAKNSLFDDQCEMNNVFPALQPQATTISTVHNPISQSSVSTSFSSTTDPYQMEAANMIRKTKSLEPENSLQDSGLIVSKQKDPFFPVFQPAFQLSPPVQKTRVFTQNATERQVSLVGIEDLVLGTPSHVCQSADSQKTTTIQTSVVQDIPKQHVTNIVIPKPVPLGQSQNFSVSVLNPHGQDPINSQSEGFANGINPDDTENVQLQPEEFANGTNPDDAENVQLQPEEFANGTNPVPEEMSRSIMLSQIEELNKQHQEAERLLRTLLQTDKQLDAGSEARLALSEYDAELSQGIQIKQQDTQPSVSAVNSSVVSPVPNFPQDQVTNHQSQEFSVAV